jgi:hypothetical protein
VAHALDLALTEGDVLGLTSADALGESLGRLGYNTRPRRPVDLAGVLAAEEAGRGAAPGPTAQPAQGLVDRVVFRLAGLTDEEVARG